MKKIMMAAVAGMLVLSATACSGNNNEPKPIVAETMEGKYITPQDTSKDALLQGPEDAEEARKGISGMGHGPAENKPLEAPVAAPDAPKHELVLPNIDTLKVKAGDTVNIVFYDGKAGESYNAEIFYATSQSQMKSQKLDVFTADEVGTVKGTVTVPTNYEPGLYTLTLTAGDEIFGGNVEVG